MSNRVIASYDVGSMSWSVSKKNARMEDIRKVVALQDLDLCIDGDLHMAMHTTVRSIRKVGTLTLALGSYGQDQDVVFALGPKDEVKKFQTAWDKVVDEDKTGDLKFSDLLKKAIKAC